MMPLSTPDTQVIKLIRTPKLPESLFQNAQPLSVKVLASEGNQATILLAGRQLATQTNLPLSAGQTLMAQPMLVNGQLQLKILPNTPAPDKSPNSGVTTPQAGLAVTDNKLLDTSLVKTSTNAGQTPQPLPDWTQTLPQSTKEALNALRQSLPNQSPLQQLLSLVNDQLQQAQAGQKTLSPAWQTLLTQALNVQAPVTAEKVQQTMQAFNDKYANKSAAEWKQALQSLILSNDASADEKVIAQHLLNRSELTQQLQSLQHQAGNAVWLQEIPLQHQQLLNNFTLEIDLPKTDQPESEQQWKILVQLHLDEGEFTSRLQMDKELNLRVQLWGSNATLTEQIQAQAPLLRQALEEQGLTIESLVIAQGIPETRTEKPLWQQPLVDCHG